MYIINNQGVIGVGEEWKNVKLFGFESWMFYFCAKVNMNDMKKALVYLVLMLALLPMDMSAQSCSESSSKAQVMIRDKRDTLGRPKAPSMQSIECWYGDGILSFDFAISEGMCNLCVADKDTGFVTNYVFDSSDHAEVFIGNVKNAAITITTSSGHTYIGEIVIL